ncbi:tetraacyldisaccharide 4'-kinase [Azotosporobacter soli]|uniref:tetraacyldisaccharide 4'-kinase n=1 Tax=Azotosporobacter soli TaxID=3055040 RepID=UPI0031FF2F85
MRQMEAIKNYLYQLVHGEQTGPGAKMLLGILHGMSVLYAWSVSLALCLYRIGFFKRHRLACKVISLGNITVGGTGKTPTAQRLASIIRDLGYRVVILNRGYRAGWKGNVGVVSDGRKIYMSVSEAGDEAYLLAKSLPGVPVIIGRNRTETGEYAVARFNADVIILDDAYQHWQLERDLDIVLIDALNVFGNNYILPRGTLREPLENLDRAQVFLLTKVDQSSDDARGHIREIATQYNPAALVVESVHKPKCFVEVADWYGDFRNNPVDLAAIKDKTVMAFSGIGNPSSFEQTITDIGAKEVCAIRYPDHHVYTMAEMQYIMEQAVDKGATALITTEKDAVKIPAEFIHSQRPLPVYVLGIEVRFMEGYAEFMTMIGRMAEDKKRG